MKIIKQISFPNTVGGGKEYKYTLDDSSCGCDEIKRVEKNGEMASIGWFEIWKDGKVIAEIKESVCNIYFT